MAAERLIPDLAAAEQRTRRLMAEGLLAQATVTAVRETDEEVNGGRVVELSLDVAVDGRDPYRVLHRQAVSPLVIGHMAPGAVVPVRVDPADAGEIMIA